MTVLTRRLMGGGCSEVNISDSVYLLYTRVTLNKGKQNF